MADASLLVDEHLANANLSDARLEAIERYWTAHLITLRDPRLTSAQMGDIRESYQRDDHVTEYLRTAAGMDPTGTIEDRFMEARPRFGFAVGAGFDPNLNLPATG
jgi:hypothetical protein